MKMAMNPFDPEWQGLESGFPYHIQRLDLHGDVPSGAKGDWGVVMLALEGRAQGEADGRALCLARGTALALPPGAFRGIAAARELKAYAVLFRPEEILGEDGASLAPLAARLAGRDYFCAAHSLALALKAYREKRPGYQQYLKAHLRWLLCLLRIQGQPEMEEKGGLAAAAAWMEAHMAEEMPLSALAAVAGVSTRQLDRLFLNRYQMTPRQYLISLRMSRARALLVQTERSVTDIAFECGYTDSNYFTRVFRKTQGQSPSRYREDRRQMK